MLLMVLYPNKFSHVEMPVIAGLETGLGGYSQCQKVSLSGPLTEGHLQLVSATHSQYLLQWSPIRRWSEVPNRQEVGYT